MQNTEDYIRPRCKVLLNLPFGLFVAKSVVRDVEPGTKCDQDGNTERIVGVAGV